MLKYARFAWNFQRAVPHQCPMGSLGRNLQPLTDDEGRPSREEEPAELTGNYM